MDGIRFRRILRIARAWAVALAIVTSTASAAPKNVEKGFLRPLVKLLEERTRAASKNGPFSYAAEVSPSLPPDQDYQIKASPSSSGIHWRLLISEKAAEDPIRALRGLLFLWSLSEPRHHSYWSAEVFVNAQAGSLQSRAALLGIEAESLKRDKTANLLLGLMCAYTGKPAEALENEIQAQIRRESDRIQNEELPPAEKAAALDLRKRRKALDDWRKETKTLETLEAQSLKLNDLIVRNDRAGVRRMIEAYLPWAVMEPVESNAWKVWLEAIEHPDPGHQTVAFRGLDFAEDHVQRLDLPDGRRNLGFMSTLLTKNQGSYTRRLRSLSTKRLQNGIFDSKADGLSISVTNQLRAHAADPMGSAFQSFSLTPDEIKIYSPSPADGKIMGAFLAVKVDSRRMIPNFMNTVVHEVELLAPLIIFPDEVLVYEENTGRNFNSFLAHVNERLDPENAVNGLAVSIKTKKSWLESGFRFFERMIDLRPSHGSCEGIWR